MPDGDKSSMPRYPGFLSGFADLDRLLRGEATTVSSLRRGAIDIDPVRLSLVVILLCMISGACMGTFALFSARGGHVMQVVASMVKVPALFGSSRNRVGSFEAFFDRERVRPGVRCPQLAFSFESRGILAR